MKIKTKEDYQKRHKPEPKKGKSRKVSLVKDSNAVLWNRIELNEQEIERRDEQIAALQFSLTVANRALSNVSRETRYPAEHYVTVAEKEVTAEMEAADSK